MPTDVERRLAVLEAILGAVDNGSCSGDVFSCTCGADCPVGNNVLHRMNLGLKEISNEVYALRNWVEEIEKWGFIPKEVRVLASLRVRHRYLSEQVLEFQSTQASMTKSSQSLGLFLENFQSKIRDVEREILLISEFLEKTYHVR